MDKFGYKSCVRDYVSFVLHEVNVANILKWGFPSECQIIHSDRIWCINDGRVGPISTTQKHGRSWSANKAADSRLWLFIGRSSAKRSGFQDERFKVFSAFQPHCDHQQIKNMYKDIISVSGI